MHHIASLLYASSPLPLMLWASLYFFTIYMLFASLIWLLAKRVNRPIEPSLIKPAQIRHELARSLRSILCFGVGILLPWSMIQLNISQIETQSNIGKIILECAFLIVWYDIHFYGSHRLLHEKFKRTHGVHHQSHTATPFSAYSMSVTEALLLGSVMPIAMLFHGFSLTSLLFLPIWSICINAFAHSNCDFFPNAEENTLLGFIKHHQSHHSHYHRNYSFFFTRLDQWFNTNRNPNSQGNP